MNLQSILAQYAGGAPATTANVDSHFDTATRELPAQVVGQGVAEAFRSDQTPPFGQMVGDLHSRSNPQQQAGGLNEILGSLGSGASSGVVGGILGRIFGNRADENPTPTTLTPNQASQLTPQQVNDIATHAEKQNPGIIDRLGEFYAQHPQLVKTLGSAALAITLAKVANRMRA